MSTMHRSRQLASVVLFVVLSSLTFTSSAGASTAAEPIDTTCSIDGAFSGGTGPTIQGSGSYSCSTPQLVIEVTVCLEQTPAVAVRCGVGRASGASSVSAGTSFPCLPGVWYVGVHGFSSGGIPASGHFGPVVILPGECDPLQP